MHYFFQILGNEPRGGLASSGVKKGTCRMRGLVDFSSMGWGPLFSDISLDKFNKLITCFLFLLQGIGNRI